MEYEDGMLLEAFTWDYMVSICVTATSRVTCGGSRKIPPLNVEYSAFVEAISSALIRGFAVVSGGANRLG
jgi:hypothetical protein